MTFWAELYSLCSVDERNGTLEVLGCTFLHSHGERSASPAPSLLLGGLPQTKRPTWVISLLPLWPSQSSNQMSSQRKFGNPKSEHSKW